MAVGGEELRSPVQHRGHHEQGESYSEMSGPKICLLLVYLLILCAVHHEQAEGGPAAAAQGGGEGARGGHAVLSLRARRRCRLHGSTGQQHFLLRGTALARIYLNEIIAVVVDVHGLFVC